ncbi:MAG: FtsX-like permease family protein, partial [Psychromonas sp.]|nr:FtsX-like permease family protein [Psychromonas sp.]
AIWPNKNPESTRDGPINLLRHRDIQHILQSDIPTYSMVHYKSEAYVRRINAQPPKKIKTVLRATTQGFFALTSAPFAFGGHWQNDNGTEVVIGDKLNQKLFAGKNSVGKSIEIDNKHYQIVGVLKPWSLSPLFYDLFMDNKFSETADLFAPLETAIDNNWGIRTMARATEAPGKLSESRERNYFYLQAFVQLDNKQQHTAFQLYLDNYSKMLKKAGLHPHDINNLLYDVPTWLKKNKVVDQKIVALAFITLLFLAVCIFNASSLLLAYYQKRNFETWLRRSLGASKQQIISQGVIESFLIGLSTSLLALVFSWLFLRYLVTLFDHLKNIAQFDMQLVLLGLCITFITTLLSSLYPLYRASKVNLSATLK